MPPESPLLCPQSPGDPLTMPTGLSTRPTVRAQAASGSLCSFLSPSEAQWIESPPVQWFSKWGLQMHGITQDLVQNAYSGFTDQEAWGLAVFSQPLQPESRCIRRSSSLGGSR